MLTIDGFFEGTNKWEISWHNVDAEFHEFAAEQLNETGMLLFGRVTYEGMAKYWTSETASKNDPLISQLMNSVPKVVFSRTMSKADWSNTRLIKGNVSEEVQKLKSEGKKDIGILGSANLASSLIDNSLIDEYRIIINPVVLGKGSPMFLTTRPMPNIKLLRSRIFKSGNVLLTYGPK